MAVREEQRWNEYTPRLVKVGGVSTVVSEVQLARGLPLAN
jgi:hypothetical protein